MKICNNCDKPFKPKHHNIKYCNDTCRGEARTLQKSISKSKCGRDEAVDKKRKDLVKKVIEKKATNKSKPFTKEDCKLIMEKEEINFKYTPTLLAIMLGRSKPSIEQKRKRLKDKLSSKVLK